MRLQRDTRRDFGDPCGIRKTWSVSHKGSARDETNVGSGLWFERVPDGRHFGWYQSKQLIFDSRGKWDDAKPRHVSIPLVPELLDTIFEVAISLLKDRNVFVVKFEGRLTDVDGPIEGDTRACIVHEITVFGVLNGDLVPVARDHWQIVTVWDSYLNIEAPFAIEPRKNSEALGAHFISGDKFVPKPLRKGTVDINLAC